MKTLLITILMLMSQLATAGDASIFTSLGFSNDGKYFAYIQDGEYDGSGIYWMSLGIIDVTKNVYVGHGIIEGLDEEEIFEVTDEQKKQFLAQLKKKLSFNKYGFSKNKIEDVLIARPHTDFSNYEETIFTVDYWPYAGPGLQRYKLLLDEVSAPLNGDNEWCYEKNNMIELRLETIQTYDGTKGSIKDLQIDKSQPKARSCSYNYSIGYVLHHKNSIAVVINYLRPGFEGPDERYMVVTGKL